MYILGLSRASQHMHGVISTSATNLPLETDNLMMLWIKELLEDQVMSSIVKQGTSVGKGWPLEVDMMDPA